MIVKYTKTTKRAENNFTKDQFIRMDISNGLGQYYVDKEDIKQWHMAQPKMKTNENWSFSQGTYTVLIRSLYIPLLNNECTIVEISPKEEKKLIEKIFTYYFNQWGKASLSD